MTLADQLDPAAHRDQVQENAEPLARDGRAEQSTGTNRKRNDPKTAD